MLLATVLAGGTDVAAAPPERAEKCSFAPTTFRGVRYRPVQLVRASLGVGGKLGSAREPYTCVDVCSIEPCTYGWRYRSVRVHRLTAFRARLAVSRAGSGRHIFVAVQRCPRVTGERELLACLHRSR